MIRQLRALGYRVEAPNSNSRFNVRDFRAWMWRKGWNYEQLTKFGSHAGQPGHRDDVRLNIE
jgi:hypothetical protein